MPIDIPPLAFGLLLFLAVASGLAVTVLAFIRVFWKSARGKLEQRRAR